MSSDTETKTLTNYYESESSGDRYSRALIERMPEGWGVIELKDICNKMVSGGTPSTSIDRYWNGEIPWMTSAHIKSKEVYNGQKNITKMGLENSTTNLIPMNNLLVATRVGIGKVAINKIDIAISQDLTGLIIDTDRASVEYVYWTLINDKKLKAYVQGSAIKGITRDELSKLKITLPKLPEQRKIASILSTINNQIEVTDSVIARTELLKKGLIYKLLTKGIGNLEFEDSDLGIIPRHWKCMPFATLTLSYKNGIYKHDKYYGSGYPCIRMYNIVDGTVNTNNSPLLNVTDAELKEYELAEGDLLINRVNSRDLVGKAGIVPPGLGQVIFESKNIRVRLNRSMILPEFMGIFIQSSLYRNQVNKFVKSAIAQSTINQDDLDNILVPLPPKDEQEKIASVIKEINSKITCEIRYRERIELVKKALMQDLLTGRVRVKPDTIAPEATP